MRDQNVPILLENPLVIMYKNPTGKITCRIDKREANYVEYGLYVCDLVRHVAKAFKVDESNVWQWVDRERRRPTTQISQAS